MTHHSRNTTLVTPTRPTLRRYSLSDVGFMSSLEKERSRNPSMQRGYSPADLSYKCTHIDSRSPGYATRVVQYNEEQEKSLPIYQSRYNRPGVFPVVHFFKKDLPLFQKSQVNVRMNSADMSKYNTPEQNRMLLESIVQSSPESKTVASHNNEVNTKSVLDALKEISRKRIHSNEEEFILKEDGKRACMNYATGTNQRKKVKFNSSQLDDSVNVKSPPSKRCSMDELKASFSSMDEQWVKKPKMDKSGGSTSPKLKSPSPKLKSPSPKLKSPSPPKLVDVETQTSLDVRAVEELVIDTIKVSNESETLKSVSRQNQTKKKALPVKIFDEMPLETMRKNRLVALMGSLTDEKTNEKQKDNSIRDSAISAENKTTPEKPLVSILSGSNKTSNKSPKHVTFNIPITSIPAVSAENVDTSLFSTASNDVANTAVSRCAAYNPVTKTSAALITPIVSPAVAEISPMKKPEMKIESKTSANESESRSQVLASVVPFNSLVSASTNSEQVPHNDHMTNLKPAPAFGFNFMPKTEQQTSSSVKLNDVMKSNLFEHKTNPTAEPSEKQTNNSPPKAGFKFNLNSPPPLTISFGHPLIPTNMSANKAVSFETTKPPSTTSQVTTSSVVNTLGAFPLLPPTLTTVGSTSLSNIVNTFHSPSGVFSSSTNSSFGTSSINTVFPSDKNKFPATPTSSSFVVDGNKPILSTTTLSDAKPSSTATANASAFMSSSNVTSMPSKFTFPTGFKSTTSGIFDSISKSNLGSTTTTIAATTTANIRPPSSEQPVESASPFAKPISSFNPSNIGFGTVFSGSTTSANTPTFGTGFNASTSMFNGNNARLSNFKTDNSAKPAFGQEMAPQFGVTTASVFPGNNIPTFKTTNSFAPPGPTPGNIFGNTCAFGTPVTSTPTFNLSTNFGGNNFGKNQNSGLNVTTSSTPVFGNLFGVTTTVSDFGANKSFQANNNVFSSTFGDSSNFDKPKFETAPFQGAQKAFGSFPVNPATTQSEVFTFGGNNKPAVFSFGNSEPPKQAFNFTADNNPSTFGVANKSFGGAFASTSAPQFNVQPGAPGMFNIGTGSSTPNRSRTQLKAKRRT